MPGTDLSLEIRKSVVAHLRADEPLTALVPDNSIYGEFPAQAVPEWPFIRIGYQIATPYEENCGSGSQNRLTIHAFAKGPSTDAISQIAKRIVAAMDYWEPAIFDDRGNGWLGTQILPDAEPDKLHAVIEFDVIAFEIA